MNAYLRGLPQPNLLLELEPRYRVFLRNLWDMLLLRTVPRVATTSRPATFWSDVFTQSGVPWSWFLESLLLHTIAVAVLTIPQSLGNPPMPPRKFSRRSQITYVPPAPTFPALQSRPPQSQETTSAANAPSAPGQPKLFVPQERAESAPAPPDVKLGSGGPDVTASNSVLPPIPLPARGRAGLPGVATTVVAPPPDLSSTASRRGGFDASQGGIVAPPPEVGRGLAGRRGGGIPGGDGGVVAPPPAVQGSIRNVGDLNIGHSEVVAPAPRLPMHEQQTMSGTAQGLLGGQGSGVVGPPPSVQRSGGLGGGRMGTVTGTGTQNAVVPPPPSMQPGATGGGSGRVSTIIGGGGQASVIPPPPSIQGAGGSGGGRGHSGSPGSNGTMASVVPPPPTVSGASGGGSGGVGGRGNALAGLVSQPVAPPAASGGGGNGGAGSMPGGGSRAMPGMSAASVGSGSGSGTGSGSGDPSIPRNTPPTNSQKVIDIPKPDHGVDLPLRLIGEVLALPNSSYFSNYEVFIAEMKLKGKAELIKLVYVSLPYQKRLVEYGMNTSRIYRLRVTRDPGCDETLLQMTWPEVESAHSDPQHPSSDAPAMGPKEGNNLLPCYRTTADDYQKAIIRGR